MEKSEMQRQEQAQEDRALFPSLYAQYQLEREGIESIEHEWGFLTYRIDGEVAHCFDFFIAKEFRDGRKRRELIRDFFVMAKQRGALYVVGQVDLKIPASARRVAFWIRIGAEAYSAQNDTIYFTMRVP